MDCHWLDCDVLIQAKNTFYAFDIAPGFWGALQRGVNSGCVRSPMMVHDEIMKGGDELTQWAKRMRAINLFPDPDQDVQEGVAAIADYVQSNFDRPRAKIFLEGADPWVIASALMTKGVVVTHEMPGGMGCKKVKIPDICKVFEVPYVNCYELLRRLGTKLS